MKSPLISFLLISFCICFVSVLLVQCNTGDDDDNDSAPTQTPTPGVTPTPTFNPGMCTVCHGFPPATGRHENHQVCCPCNTCHASSVDEFYNYLSNHDNVSVDVLFSHGGTWTGSSCSGLSSDCHGTKNW